MTDPVEDFLAHAGIKGMRWGHRKRETPNSSDRGPDTPTRGERREARRENKARNFEGKAAKFDVAIKDLDRDIRELPLGFRNNYKRSMLVELRNESTAQRDSLIKDAKAVREGKLTKNQKHLVIGAVAVAAVLGTMYAATKVDSGEFNSLKLRGESFLKGEEFSFKKNAKFSDKNLTPDEVYANVVKGINPKYNTQGGSINCRRTSFAYELRRRGMDVVATPSNTGTGQSESGLINAITPGKGNKSYTTSLMNMVVREDKGIRGKGGRDQRSNPATVMAVQKTTAGNLIKAFSSQPDGARGEIVFNFGQFGHSMAYEIFGGKPVIFDTQKAQKYDLDDYSISQMFAKWGTASNAEITRLDNVDLDMKFLSRWATNS